MKQQKVIHRLFSHLISGWKTRSDCRICGCISSMKSGKNILAICCFYHVILPEVTQVEMGNYISS